MLDGVNLDGGTCLGDAVKKRANETAGHFSGLMLTTGFRPKRYVRFWPHLVRKYPFLLSESARAPQKESKYLQQAQSWERVLHTENREWAKLRLLSSAWASKCRRGKRKHNKTAAQSVGLCVLVADFQLSGQDSFRCARGLSSLSRTSPGRTHPSGTATGENEWKKDPNG